MIPWGSLLTLLKEHKKILASVLLIIALAYGAFSVNRWYDDQIQTSYNHGVAVTDQKWEKVVEKNDKERQQFKDASQARVDSLEAELAAEKAKNADNDTNGGTKQIEYIQSPVSQKVALDDKFVEIYNDSLGVKNEK